MNSIARGGVIAALICCALHGCALPGRAAVMTPATYELRDGSSAAQSEPAQTELVLKVNMPVAAPGLTTSRMAYVQQPYRIDYFAENEWVDSPARMLRTVLATRLMRTGLFAFVFADAGSMDEQLRLDTELLQFEQNLTNGASEVRLTVRFTLVDVARRSVVLSQLLSITEPATARDPYAGVVAANAAVQRALDELVGRLREAIVSLAAAPAAQDVPKLSRLSSGS